MLWRPNQQYSEQMAGLQTNSLVNMVTTVINNKKSSNSKNNLHLLSCQFDDVRTVQKRLKVNNLTTCTDILNTEFNERMNS